jgi:carbamoyltransferase
MEFGSRALGFRSILASPVSPAMRERLNTMKAREQFRPVAPVVTSEAFNQYFDGTPNRYMSLTATVRDEVRGRLPSAVHVDGSARVQTVWQDHDPFLHSLLCEFQKRSGVPVLINTSLNVRGRPIAESPQEALSCFLTTTMDFLILGNVFVHKRDEWRPTTGRTVRREMSCPLG